ncbi:MAG: twin-arginine translocase subunit TatC [Gammaproteobacteria bacterium]|nr:twin-arginine translocase subunit TatC [Gammaproteobacteria bacterium]
MTDSPSSLLAHLQELRSRLLRGFAVILLLFCGLAFFASELFSLLSQPLLAFLPEGSNMIATDVATPFLTPFKLAFVAAIFIGMPFLLFQVWAFIAPGLYRQEKRLFIPLLLSSIVLFYAGIAFAFFVVFPLVFRFLTAVTPEGVSMMTDISAYLDFVLTLFFAFGLAFEVPVATVLLVWAGVTTPSALAEKRPYVLLGAFVIGMFLTPPDVISQTLLALPMYVLFEIGILMSRWLVSGWQEVEAQRKAEREARSEEDA